MSRQVMICASENYFTDDIASDCGRCGARIYLRPYSQKIETNVCYPCGEFLMTETSNFEFCVLPETIKEIRRVLELGGIFRQPERK